MISKPYHCTSAIKLEDLLSCIGYYYHLTLSSISGVRVCMGACIH